MDLDLFRLPSTVNSATNGKQNRRRQTGPFIRGPIPLAWLQPAAALPGKSPLLMALALAYQSGLNKSKDGIRVTDKLLAEFFVKKRTAYDALSKLESAGLIEVRRPPGRCRVVRIRQFNGSVQIDNRSDVNDLRM